MERSKPLPKFKELFIVDGEKRPLQCGKHPQLIRGPFDSRQRGANGFDFFAAVKRLPPDEQMWNPASLNRIDIEACHVFAEACESSKQERDVTRLEGNLLFVAVGLTLRDVPAVPPVGQPRDKRTKRIRRRHLDCPR